MSCEQCLGKTSSNTCEWCDGFEAGKKAAMKVLMVLNNRPGIKKDEWPAQLIDALIIAIDLEASQIENEP